MRAAFCLMWALTYLVTSAHAKTHTWWYESTEVKANPDGTYERIVHGFNNTWPLPTLRVKKGDTVNFYLINGFDDRNTSLHFHGLFQHGSNQMDGPQFVTQCPIPPGETMLYNFTVPDQVGTYWYHSHTGGQYMDGMRGTFIIEDDDDVPFEYDEEVVLELSEWYHKLVDEMLPDFLNRYNPTGAEPIPQNLLFNNTRNNTWNVEPDKTYFLRIINVGGFVSQYVWMEDHEFTVVEVDGIYVKPNTTDMLYITVAQRYGVLVKTKKTTDKNYAFMTKFDDTMLDVIPNDLLLNSTNYIVYNESLGVKGVKENYVDELDPMDDFYLRPLNNETLFDDPDVTITVDVDMINLGNGVNYAFFNNLTYTTPKVPTIITAMTAGKDASNPMVYGTNVNSFVVEKDEVVDIVVNNIDTGKHPFHLHGHVFQLIERYKEVPDDQDPVAYDASNHADFPEYPMSRDTVYVNPQSYIVLRFKADNPGVWFFHCHIEWHLEQGLALVLIEAPTEMQNDPNQAFTDDFKRTCTKNGIPLEGNAAANSKDYLDLSGENVQHGPLPAGFTARGIVALVFSCVAAVLGLIAITVYGLSDINNIEERVARDLDIDIVPEDDAIEGSSSEIIETSK